MVSEGLLGCFSCLFWVKSFCKMQHSMRNWGSKKRYSEETAISEKGNSKYKATKAATNLDYSLKKKYFSMPREKDRVQTMECLEGQSKKFAC